MSVPSQGGFFAFAPQNARTDEGGYSAPTSWKRVKTTQLNMGTVEDARQFPLEVGGVIVPTGAFKTGAAFGGGVQLIPRMEDDFGWLLYAALGAVDTQPGPEAGTYEHTFTFATDDSVIPWMEFAKYVPGAGAETLLERGKDGKISSLVFTIPQAGLVQAALACTARIPSLASDISLTGYGAMEGVESALISSKGSITVDGNAQKAVGAVVSIMNNLTSFQQERILGSYYMDDMVPLTRAAEFRFTQKWQDPDLYQEILTGSAAGTTWTPVQFSADIDILVESPGNIGATATPYSVEFIAPNVAFRPDGPPALAPGDIVMHNYVGVANEQVGSDYLQVVVINDTSVYTWPV